MAASISKKLGIALLATGFLFAQEVTADPIDGTINFTGGVRVTQSGSTALVDFFAGTTSVDGAPFTGSPTGDYAGIAVGTAATFSDFRFDTGSLVLNPLSVNVWTVNSGGLTYTFTLDHLNAAVLADPLNGTMIQGTGVANITGGGSYSATPGAFVLAGSGTNTLFRFSSGTAIPSDGGGIAVPDGGSAVALLGIAMIGLEGLRRKLLMP